jgi:cell fate (sporulation/competence/biofilm development) regulator YlbF (YheA/YmcA/DUF963 family)
MARLAHDDPIIIDKVIALCETIIARPGFSSVRNAVNEFINDDTARARYAAVNRLGTELAEKQQRGAELAPEEIESYQTAREELGCNAVVAAFLDAQHQLHRLEATLHAYITKTLQLGRVPTESDFAADSCGPACGCHSSRSNGNSAT